MALTMDLRVGFVWVTLHGSREGDVMQVAVVCGRAWLQRRRRSETQRLPHHHHRERSRACQALGTCNSQG
jgi:hypothetical protein